MNDAHEDHVPEEDRDNDFLELVMRYQDGTLPDADVQKLSELIRNDPEKQKLFRRIQIRTVTLHDIFRMDAFGRTSPLLDIESNPQDESDWNPDTGASRPTKTPTHSLIRWIGGVSVAALLLVGVLVWNSSAPRQVELVQPGPVIPVPQKQSVLLVEEDRAKFVGSEGLTAGSRIEHHREYLLQSGLVKLLFPSGATVILEAPSIFQVESAERLVLNTGGCSVHAPDGAEGFEVLTPLTKVVDRGTRFYINVQDNSETEVHVIEGAADLYSPRTSNGDILSQEQGNRPNATPSPIRLEVGESVRLGGFANMSDDQKRFSQESFRGQLPDRVVSYVASSTANGSADELTSLTVQRQGKNQTCTADELIPVQVVSFRGDPAPERNGYTCGFHEKPERPEDLLEDRKLVTGLINFGGQPQPMNPQELNSLRTQGGASAPPGLGIRFRSPVVNIPGPDVVLFEVQPFGNPVEGDPFHVYPVSDRPDLKSVTIRQFDLILNSPTVRGVDPLWSHRSQQVANSLEDLRNLETPIIIDVGHSHFQVIAVGIDLSDLGYAEGEDVEELFFQHASGPDGHKLDPVMIVGLPPVSSDR